MPDDANLHIYDDHLRTAKMYRCPTCGQRAETVDPRPLCPNDGDVMARTPR